VATNTPAVFVSYSRDDSDFALQLAKDLKTEGIVVWIDQQSIEPGQDWDNAIEEALIQCTHMVLILSPSAVDSRNVRNEIAFAFDEQKTILPVLHKDCAVPLQLRRVQHIDFRTDYALGLVRLMKALGIAGPPPQITPAVTPPPLSARPEEPKIEIPSPEKPTVFFDSAEANALSGYMKRPLQAFIPPQANVTLPPGGGLIEQRVEGYRFGGILSCLSCSSHASSSENDETGERTTWVSSTIEGLNVSEILTADRVVAQISIAQGADEAKPTISLVGTRFEKLRIAGEAVHILLDFASAKPDPTTLVARIEGNLPVRITGNVIDVPGYGKISLANIVRDFDSAQLTMIQFLFSGAVQGNLAVATCRAGMNSRLTENA
jgi:hypothetical protein